jgi:hypothetical protein
VPAKRRETELNLRFVFTPIFTTAIPGSMAEQSEHPAQKTMQFIEKKGSFCHAIANTKGR